MNAPLSTIPIGLDLLQQKERTFTAWLGMAGVLDNTRATVILIDPLISLKSNSETLVSEAGYPLKVPLPIQAGDLRRVDAVLYTHADDDHIGRVTIKTLAQQTQCIFIAPPPVAKIIQEEGVPSERIHLARDFETLRVGQAEITITPALHDWQEVNPWQRGDCCGYLVKTPDGSIWHPGDTRLIDELLDFKNVDVLFFDIAAVNSHLGPEGSARLGASSGARVMIAYHYGTFDLPPGSFANCDPQDALPFVEGMAAPLLQLNPGEPFWMPF